MEATAHTSRFTVPPRDHDLDDCSCGRLLRLVGSPTVAETLEHRGISPEDVASAQARFHHRIDPEPLDWAARLSARRPAAAPEGVADLVAILRSPETHACQVLVRAGLPVAALRRSLLAAPVSDPRVRSETGPVEAPPVPGWPRRSAPGAPKAPDGSGPRAVPIEEDTTGEGAAPDAPPSPHAAAAAPPVDPATRIHPEGLAPLFGRRAVLERLADAVERVRPRPVLLVGASGSGRSLVAAHLSAVVERPVFRLDAAVLDEDPPFEDAADEAAAACGVLVIDDLDRAAGEHAPHWLGSLARLLSRTDVAVVVVTSPELARRLETWLPGLFDALDQVRLPALSHEERVAAVVTAAPSILAGHGLAFEDERTPRELVRLAERFLGGRAMPGRAVDLLDLACARARREGHPRLGVETVVTVVAERSGLPRERVAASDEGTLLDLERRLARHVVGHEEPLSAIADLIRRNRAGFSGGRPVATVLLLGPSGVGKTEVAKALATALYDDPAALVRLDMSEYAEPHAVARVVGAPPGYVGYEQGGALSDPLLRRPHCVVLLDEIEKAHRDVHQLLLQVFDDGRLTDGRGRTVDFSDAVIVMTSNLGSDLLHRNPAVDGREVLDVARNAFPVELWNRIEAPLVMRPLSADELVEICKRLARRASDRLFRARGVRFTLSQGACKALVEAAGGDAGLGARPLRHLLARHVESRIARAILAGDLPPGSGVLVEHVDGRFELR